MKVGIIQSNYIPWRGYFDFIDDVDLFIFHDDLQYTKNDWRNRNRIKTPDGTPWLTVSVHLHHTNQRIQDTRIDYSTRWPQTHLNRLRSAYGRAPYFESYFCEFKEILKHRFEFLSELNIALCRWVMNKLPIETPTRSAAEFGVLSSKSERLISLLQSVSASTYLSGPVARSYIDEALFRRNRIRIEYKSYDYPPYAQPWGAFVGDVTVLDLLFNTGPKARRYLKSRSKPSVGVEAQ